MLCNPNPNPNPNPKPNPATFNDSTQQRFHLGLESLRNTNRKL